MIHAEKAAAFAAAFFEKAYKTAAIILKLFNGVQINLTLYCATGIFIHKEYWISCSSLTLGEHALSEAGLRPVFSARCGENLVYSEVKIGYTQ